jgi:hypothetical protein
VEDLATTMELLLQSMEIWHTQLWISFSALEQLREAEVLLSWMEVRWRLWESTGLFCWLDLTGEDYNRFFQRNSVAFHSLYNNQSCCPVYSCFLSSVLLPNHFIKSFVLLILSWWYKLERNFLSGESTNVGFALEPDFRFVPTTNELRRVYDELK